MAMAADVAGSCTTTGQAHPMRWVCALTYPEVVHHPYARKRRRTRAAFWPPKPKLVDTAVSMRISRALLGT